MRKIILSIILLSVFMLSSCNQENANDAYEELYSVYEQYSEYCNGHSTESSQWTIFVNVNTPDEIINKLEENYIVELRTSDSISLDNLNDIVIGYFSQLSTWSIIEQKSTYIKIITDASTIISSEIILDYIDLGLIDVEYSEGDLVFTT